MPPPFEKKIQHLIGVGAKNAGHGNNRGGKSFFGI